MKILENIKKINDKEKKISTKTVQAQQDFNQNTGAKPYDKHADPLRDQLRKFGRF